MQNGKSKGVKTITIITTTIMFICIILLAFQFTKINTLNNRQTELLEQKEYLTNELFDYESINQYRETNRTEYLEEYARNSLNWKKTDQNWYTSE